MNFAPGHLLVLCLNPSVDTLCRTDSVRAGAVNRLAEERRFPGGKGVHVALAAKELGAQEVVLLGFWGGPTGDFIRSQCEAAGIHCAGPSVAEWNRVCMTIADKSGRETQLLGTGPGVHPSDWRHLLAAYRKHLRHADCVVMSGSLPPGVPETSYADLIHAAERKPVVLDASGRALSLALGRRPSLLHLNASEAAQAVGTRAPKKAAPKLLKFSRRVCVSDGSRGLFLAEGDRCVHARCEVNNVICSVGSGDCCTAALAISLGLPLETAAAMAAAAGAANCLRSELGMLRRLDFQSLMRKTKVADS